MGLTTDQAVTISTWYKSKGLTFSNQLSLNEKLEKKRMG